MSKDGTSRGGKRMGAGRKSKSTSTKLLEGKIKKEDATSTKQIIQDKDDSKYTAKLDDFMEQTCDAGGDLHTRRIYDETWKYLKDRGCENEVDRQLVELYAHNVARWKQCEEKISEEGLKGSHPTTGADTVSPYVNMQNTYMKQVLQLWNCIYDIVREHGGGITDEVDMMESILSGS